MIDTNQLQAFEYVVRHGSFSKAARELGIAQPTVSVRMRTLEKAVGGALFVRRGTRVTLTERGMSFLPYARQVLATLATGIETAERAARGEHGRLQIATLPSLAGGFFAAAIARMEQEYPHISLIVHTGHTQQVGEMLRDGFVKLGFMTWPIFYPDLTVALRLQEPLIAVAHPSHPLAQYERLMVADLQAEGHPFFHIDWNKETHAWHTGLVRGGERDVEVPPQLAYDRVVRGHGVALLTETMVADDLLHKRLIALQVDDLPRFARESVLVHLTREDQLSPVAMTFIAVIHEEARLMDFLRGRG